MYIEIQNRTRKALKVFVQRVYECKGCAPPGGTSHADVELVGDIICVEEADEDGS